MTYLGADHMTFYKEGRKLNYKEAIQMVETLIEKEIIFHLEEEELNAFFSRLFHFSGQIVEEYLNKLDYKVMNIRQSYCTLENLKKISKINTWENGIEIYEEIKAGKANEEKVIRYMTEELLEAMKELNENLFEKAYF